MEYLWNVYLIRNLQPKCQYTNLKVLIEVNLSKWPDWPDFNRLEKRTVQEFYK